MLSALRDGADSVRYSSWVTLFEFEAVLRRKLNQKLIIQSAYEEVQVQWAELQKSLNFIPLDSRSARTGLRLQKL